LVHRLRVNCSGNVVFLTKVMGMIATYVRPSVGVLLGGTMSQSCLLVGKADVLGLGHGSVSVSNGMVVPVVPMTVAMTMAVTVAISCGNSGGNTGPSDRCAKEDEEAETHTGGSAPQLLHY